MKYIFGSFIVIINELYSPMILIPGMNFQLVS